MCKFIVFLLTISLINSIEARNITFGASRTNLSGKSLPLVVVCAAGVGGLVLKLVGGSWWKHRVGTLLEVPEDRISIQEALSCFYFFKWRVSAMVNGGCWPTAYDLHQAGWQKVLPVLFRDLEGAGAQAFVIKDRSRRVVINPKHESVPASQREICAGHVPTLATLKELELALLKEVDELRGSLDHFGRLKKELIRALKTVDPNVGTITSLVMIKPEELDQVEQLFYQKNSNRIFSKSKETLNLYFKLACAYTRTNVLLEMVRDEISMRQAPGVIARRGPDHVNITNVVNLK